MDTRSKNTSPSDKPASGWEQWDQAVGAPEPPETGRTYSHWFLKLLAIAACVLAVCYAVRGALLWGVYGLLDTDYYFGSAALSEDMTATMRQAASLYYYYIDEGATETGASPAGEARAQRLSELSLQYTQEKERLAASGASDEELSQLEEEFSSQYDLIARQDAAAIAELTQQLDSHSGVLVACIDEDGSVRTNYGESAAGEIQRTFEALPAAAYYGTGFFGSLPQNAVTLTDTSMYRDVPASSAVYVGYTAQLFEEKAAAFESSRNAAAAGPGYLLWGALVALGSMMWLAFTAGKSAAYDGIRPTFIDGVYSDVLLAACIGAMALCIGLLDFFVQRGMADMKDFALGLVNSATLLTMYGPIVLATLVFLCAFLSFSRKLKLHTLYRHSLLGRIFRRLGLLLRSAVVSVRAGTLSKRTTAATMGYVLLGALVMGVFVFLTATLNALGAVVGAAFFMAYCLWLNHRMILRARELGRIIDDVKRIGKGELSHRTAASQKSEFKALTEGINDIANGLEVSLEEKLRSERLRTELISNVSHDLRTPLTGLITYIDLLRSKNLNEADQKKYLDILDQKAHRLKTLTDDLFEAAKAASGTLPVKRERIDVKALLTQGFTELSDAIEASGVTVHTLYKNEPVYALADGQRLWRALENLITNALKYSLPGSRVYIQAETDAAHVFITVKNVSREPLTDDVELLAERFTRGDAARHSEGSGLGLAITNSLCELMKGQLTLSAEGDLFRAKIQLEKA